jgi:TusA-related sulfurtransferase
MKNYEVDTYERCGNAGEVDVIFGKLKDGRHFSMLDDWSGICIYKLGFDMIAIYRRWFVEEPTEEDDKEPTEEEDRELSDNCEEEIIPEEKPDIWNTIVSKVSPDKVIPVEVKESATSQLKKNYRVSVTKELNKLKDVDTEDVSTQKNFLKKKLASLEEGKILTEDVDTEAVKDKIENDIQEAGKQDMIDTKQELEDGIKKEIYQYTKQQGLDIEKLRKQGIELESIADTVDKIVGNMVSKSAIEYMDQTSTEIEWDYEIVNNDIHIVWNEI